MSNWPQNVWWGVQSPWQDMKEEDEFEPGTLDGKPADGGSHDACGPASVEDGAAAYEHRLPKATNIGFIRKDMLDHGQYGGGCTLANLVWEIPRRHYRVFHWLNWQAQTLGGSEEIGYALNGPHGRHAVIFEVHNAQMLHENEQGVHNHFVVVTAWSTAPGREPHLYVLNSDIARASRPGGGIQTGEWMTVSDFLKADPRGYISFGPVPAPAPAPQPTPVPTPVPAPKPTAPDVAGATSSLKAAQSSLSSGNVAAAQAAVADALKKLGA